MRPVGLGVAKVDKNSIPLYLFFWASRCYERENTTEALAQSHLTTRYRLPCSWMDMRGLLLSNLERERYAFKNKEALLLASTQPV